MSYRFWCKHSQDVDLTNLGYSKNDVVVVSLIELIPTIVSNILVTQFLSGESIHREVKNLLSILLAQLCDIFFTLVIPPYVNGTTSQVVKNHGYFHLGQ